MRSKRVLIAIGNGAELEFNSFADNLFWKHLGWVSSATGVHGSIIPFGATAYHIRIISQRHDLAGRTRNNRRWRGQLERKGLQAECPHVKGKLAILESSVANRFFLAINLAGGGDSHR